MQGMLGKLILARPARSILAWGGARFTLQMLQGIAAWLPKTWNLKSSHGV